jgi:hypothetical protein
LTEDFDRGVDWAAGGATPLSQLVYNVYSEADYDVIWDRWGNTGGGGVVCFQGNQHLGWHRHGAGRAGHM